MTKKRVITISATIGAFAISWLVICFAAAQSKSDKAPPKTDKKEPAAANPVDDAYQLILEATKRQRDAYQKHLDEDVDRGRRVDALLTKYEEMTIKEEDASKRYLKILDTWEKQQQQYQKYLDSLPKK